MKITIRNEETKDYKRVEEVTRKAFYNIYIPGCTEHYLVHKMRGHKDFISELAFVIEVDDTIIGNIMYTRSKLVDENGSIKDILTFGPLSVLPEYQRKGYGKKLLRYSFEKAIELGYDLIVIFGSPSNYVTSGVKCCKRFNICMEDGSFPSAMMVKELNEETLDGNKWVYHESPVMDVNEEEANIFDDSLEKMEKKYHPIQEEFYILSQSTIRG